MPTAGWSLLGVIREFEPRVLPVRRHVFCLAGNMGAKSMGVVIVMVVGAIGCGGRASPDVSIESGGTSGSSGSAGVIHDVADCQVSVPRNVYGGGFESCNGADMFVHRSVASLCASRLPRSSVALTSSSDECTSDEQCTGAPNGFCDPDGRGIRVCQYGCLNDKDCARGSICLCGTYVGYCTAANCSTDGDCGSGLLCAEYWKRCHTQTGFACQTPSDTCIDDHGCGADGRCEIGEDGARRCVTGECSSPSAD